MSLSSRPTTYNERDQINRSLEAWASDPAADPAAVAYEATYFASFRKDWMEVRKRYLSQHTISRSLTADMDAANARLAPIFRRWYGTITDDNGRPRLAELGSLLGGVSIAAIPRMSPSQEVSTLIRLLAVVADRPELQGDPTHYKALQEAVTDMQARVAVDESAKRARVQQGTALAEANVAFDRAYGNLVRAFRSMLGEAGTWRILPRFVRHGADEEAKATGAPAGAPTGMPA